MKRVWWGGLAAWLVVVALAGCGEPMATAEPVFLQASGSASMAPLVAELAAGFHERVPGVQMEVVGLDTVFGLEALRAGGVDLALASWLPAEGELEEGRWQARAIARDGVAVVVHPDNPLKGLGLLQLRDLFSGRIYDWEVLGMPGLVGEVQVICREEGSGTRAAFKALVMEEREVTPRALLALSPEAVLEAVGADRRAIGTLALGDVGPEVKVLEIEGTLPTRASVTDGSYALARDLWVVYRAPAAAGVQRFVDFVLSPAGQQIVGREYGRVR